MKVMAVGTLQPLSEAQRREHMPKEVPGTLKLYLEGKIEQFWSRADGRGVIFLLEVADATEADTLLRSLPLGHNELLTFDLIPVGPLAPLGLLIKE